DELIAHATPDAMTPPPPEPSAEKAAEMPATAEEAASQPVQFQPPQALDALLQRGRWFQVYDHQHQCTRWLKVESYYPMHDSVAFTEFDGANPLCMKAAQFADDLRGGCSAPTSPD